MIQLQTGRQAGITRPVDEREIDSPRVLPNNNVYQSSSRVLSLDSRTPKEAFFLGALDSQVLLYLIQ